MLLPHPAPTSLRWLLACVFLGLVPACASSGDSGIKLISQPYRPNEVQSSLSTGQLIVECERHLRTWQSAYAQPRTQASRDAIEFTERAIVTLVHREQAKLEVEVVAGSPRNRGIASAALGFSGDPEVLTLMASNVSSEDEMVASNAILGLGIMAHQDTPLSPIYAAVMDRNDSVPIVRNAAYATLRLADSMREDSSGTMSSIFVRLLDNQDGKVRGQAIIGLGLLKAAHALPLITAVLVNDDVARVRTGAAWAIGEIGNLASIDVLIDALDDQDRIVVGTARAALVKLHGRDFGKDPEEWRQVLNGQR